MAGLKDRLLELAAKAGRSTAEDAELALRRRLDQLRQKHRLSARDVRMEGEILRKLRRYTFQGFLSALAARGYAYPAIEELEESVKDLRGDAIQAIVSLIPDSPPHIQSELVHLVARTTRTYDATPLAALYDNRTAGDPLRWIIGNCVAQSQARKIDDWVREKLSDPDDNCDWERLAEYAGKRLPAQEVIDLLKPLISLSPPNVAYGLSFCGGEAEIEFLQAFHDSIRPHGNAELRLNIRRPINRIRKRLERRAEKPGNN